MKKSLLIAISLFLQGFFFQSAIAYEVGLIGDKTQGGLVIGKVSPGIQVIYKDKSLRVSDQGHFLLGFSRDEPSNVSYSLKFADGTVEKKTITIKKRHYKEEVISGLASNKVSPSQAETDRIISEQQIFDNARKMDDPREDFLQLFIWPVKGRISGVYGSRRVLNGVPKRPHYGLDVAAPAGKSIKAPADGVVSINQPDLFYTGVTVMLDHGHGLSTLYIHMKKSNVEKGQYVKQGDIIGEVGQTGRATGPHLHWGMSLFGVRLDPQLMMRSNDS